jgi:prevent-host-death family protein
MKNWALQDAKARLSEVIKQAGKGDPQQISVRGQPTAVVLSQSDYRRLTGQKPDFVTFIAQSPLGGLELEIERNDSPAREVSL